MSDLLVTIGISFLFFMLCLFMLGIGWFLTGNAKLKLGMCGRIPTQKKSKSKGCGTDPQCPLCGKQDDTDISETTT